MTRTSYKNYLSVIWQMLNKKDFVTVVLKDNTKHTWRHIFVYAYIKDINMEIEHDYKIMKIFDFWQNSYNIGTDQKGDFLEFDYKDCYCKFYGPESKIGILSEVFSEDYAFLQPEASTVIDIGAHIGDSAIYFAFNNAKKIIALEPYPIFYECALKNIDINNLKDKIILLNAGYGKDAEIAVDPKKIVGGNMISPSSGKEELGPKKIKLFSLKTLVNNYNLNNGSLLLKMDCEGCEYNLLNENNEILRQFERIQIEFHYGYKNLESKLREAGFFVKHTNPIILENDEVSLRKMALANNDCTNGFIYAERHTI